MPRIRRIDIGGEIYHVLNRANARVQIFDNNNDYQQFEGILEEAPGNGVSHHYNYYVLKIRMFCMVVMNEFIR